MAGQGELSKLVSIPDLCAALSQCCSLCGRSVGANDMYLHLRHQHARDYTRTWIVVYRYLVDMTPQTRQCSVCTLHTTAAHECPIFLQLAGLLCVSTTDIEEQDQNQVQQIWGVLKALTSPMEDDESSLPQSKRQKAAHFPAKSKGKGKARKNQPGTQQPEDLRHIAQTLARPGTTLSSTRRRSERTGHGAGLRAFFEPRPREHHVEDDAGHRGMALDRTDKTGPLTNSQRANPARSISNAAHHLSC